jgi:hypothetical protein
MVRMDLTWHAMAWGAFSPPPPAPPPPPPPPPPHPPPPPQIMSGEDATPVVQKKLSVESVLVLRQAVAWALKGELVASRPHVMVP